MHRWLIRLGQFWFHADFKMGQKYILTSKKITHYSFNNFDLNRKATKNAKYNKFTQANWLNKILMDFDTVKCTWGYFLCLIRSSMAQTWQAKAFFIFYFFSVKQQMHI